MNRRQGKKAYKKLIAGKSLDGQTIRAVHRYARKYEAPLGIYYAGAAQILATARAVLQPTIDAVVKWCRLNKALLDDLAKQSRSEY
jgi:hypothetical protein